MTEPEELLPQLDLEEHLRDPGIKQRFVTAMFEVVAPRYDRFTRAFSFGMDRGWKRQLLAELDGKVQGNATVLDLASGTGDLALGATMRLPQARALGLDVSRRMVKAAVQRTSDAGSDRVRFSVAHMLHLPVRDTAVDAVTVGYRVLRPGGLLLVLDFYRPRNGLWRSLYLGYLRAAGSLYGWLWHRQAVAYGYIAPSIEHYISWQDFSAALEQRGFVVERVSRKLFGGIGIHVACKAESGGGMA
jgi:demethylmenaquinone methyltransferase/2-methoxy-6-polyprenyl-1,4-benzoquinol methylase